MLSYGVGFFYLVQYSEKLHKFIQLFQVIVVRYAETDSEQQQSRE